MSRNQRRLIGYLGYLVATTVIVVVANTFNWADLTFFLVMIGWIFIGCAVLVPWMITGKWPWQFPRRRPER